MLIYTEHSTPRLRYVLNYLFRDVLATDFRLTGDEEAFREDGGPKISYSKRSFENVLNIPYSGFLARHGIREADPGFDASGTIPVLFHRKFLEGEAGTAAYDPSRKGPLDPAHELDFDLFAAVFYMISRYEEYLPFEGDRHGRFEAAASLAGREGFLEIPVVDIWVKEFREILTKRFPGLQLPAGNFRFLPSCDIDLPFAYLHRGRARTLGAGVRAGIRGNGDRQLRRKVFRGELKDPFDTYVDIEAIHSLHKLRPRVFFLTARYGRFDKSIHPRRKAFRDLVRQTMNYADVGLHPSYRSSENPAELRKELRTLSGISGEEVTRSRQHYLKFRLPKHYRNYLEAGIREEYSMGFASAAGFRAGTSRPFLFYDLQKEEETSLRVIPFQVMDRTLKDYMHLEPGQALDRIMALAGAVRSAGGNFVSIWHNDAFSDQGEWQGWKDVYLQMIDSLAP